MKHYRSLRVIGRTPDDSKQTRYCCDIIYISASHHLSTSTSHVNIFQSYRRGGMNTDPVAFFLGSSKQPTTEYRMMEDGGFVALVPTDQTSPTRTTISPLTVNYYSQWFTPRPLIASSPPAAQTGTIYSTPEPSPPTVEEPSALSPMVGRERKNFWAVLTRLVRRLRSSLSENRLRR